MPRPSVNRNDFRIKLTEYWAANYTTVPTPDCPIPLCSLCGNTGMIDTTRTARSHGHINAGRLNWCLCPNGRAIAGVMGKSPRDCGFQKKSDFMRARTMQANIATKLGKLQMSRRERQEIQRLMDLDETKGG